MELTRFAALFSRPPWRRGLDWPILLFALFGSFGAAVSGSTIGALAGSVIWGAYTPEAVLAMMAGQYAALPVLLLILGLWPPKGRFAAKLGIRPLKRGDLWAVLIGLAVMLLLGEAVTSGWKALLDWAGIAYQEKQDILEVISRANLPVLFGMALCTIVGAPVAEEIFFRRVLYGLLRPIGTVRAVLLTSLIFSAIHFFLLGIPALFLMGLAFHVIYLVRRNLATAMLMHGVMNLFAFAGTLLFPQA
ncbi:MAG: CPBP family intramembrane metalloprotease [Lentisphaeria bacterium]|nr:CPBP family intramembrane metalloprotease [Lentisphaeria bacterium]